jgi:microcystin-dependent protein
MPVPIPINLVMGAIPQGFKGSLQDLANIIIDNTTATVDATFLVGQIGGTVPHSNIGPWANGDEWWFWNSRLGQYTPSNQGTPVGTIAMWGGQGAPTNWLLCDGRAVARSVYSFLFQAIGVTWGVGDGQSTFNLPPGGKFYVNAQGFVAETGVPIDAGYTGQGVNSRGGQQTHKLVTSDMPAMWAQAQSKGGVFGGTAGTHVTLPPYASPTPDTNYSLPVIDAHGVPTGGGKQTPTPIMPPFCAVNYIIKYQ